MYKIITQNEEGQLLAWYGMPDHTWNVEMDFDVLTDYAVYPYEWIVSWLWTYVAEYTPANNCFWAYNTLEEALEAVLNKVNEKQKAIKKLEEAGAKFQEVRNTNSLDQRYKDKVVEKKLRTNEELREKYAVARMNTTARMNRDYYARLLDH